MTTYVSSIFGIFGSTSGNIRCTRVVSRLYINMPSQKQCLKLDPANIVSEEIAVDSVYFSFQLHYSNFSGGWSKVMFCKNFIIIIFYYNFIIIPNEKSNFNFLEPWNVNLYYARRRFRQSGDKARNLGKSLRDARHYAPKCETNIFR